MLTDEQLKVLMSPLNAGRVSKRKQGGRDLSYLEAFDVKATLIRVFGFGGFSADVIKTDIIRMEKDVPAFTGYKENRKRRTDEDGNPDFNWSVTAMVTLRLTIHALGDVTFTESAAASQTGPDVGEVTDFAIKGLSLDTPIPTPSGWTTMGEIEVGDVVFDMHGKPTLVFTKSEVKNLPCYRVTFNDGRQIVCDEEHHWYARNGLNAEVGVHSVTDLYETKSAGGSVSIPLNGALKLADAALPVDPWTLGYWLGNGDRNSGRVTCHQDDAPHVRELVLAGGHEIGTVTQDSRSRAVGIRIGSDSPGSRGGLTTELRHLGILGEKVIPLSYLRSSFDQRIELLRGLMDSDGTVGTGGRPSFSTTSRVLAEQVSEIVHSLGDRPSLTEYVAHGYGKDVVAYRVDWTPSVNPFSLPRKREKVQLRVKKGSNRVRSIEKIESVPTQCIGVESESKSYLAGEGMVPTHNTAESDALKRAAIYLGTQYGLSLYANGSTAEVVRRIVAPGQEWPKPEPVDPEKAQALADSLGAKGEE